MDFLKHFNVEDKLSCPICYQDYSDSVCPLILPCGHTICRDCFGRVKNSTNDEDEDEENSESESVNETRNEQESVADGSEQAADRNMNDQTRENPELNPGDEQSKKSEEEVDAEKVVQSFKLTNIVKLVAKHDEDESKLSDYVRSVRSHLGLKRDIKPENTKVEKGSKLKFKCSICRVMLKIYESEVVVNTQILKFSKELHDHHTKDTKSTVNPKAKPGPQSSCFFCRDCKKTYRDDATSKHKLLFPEHEKFGSLKDFESFKESAVLLSLKNSSNKADREGVVVKSTEEATITNENQLYSSCKKLQLKKAVCEAIFERFIEKDKVNLEQQILSYVEKPLSASLPTYTFAEFFKKRFSYGLIDFEKTLEKNTINLEENLEKKNYFKCMKVLKKTVKLLNEKKEKIGRLHQIKKFINNDNNLMLTSYRDGLEQLIKTVYNNQYQIQKKFDVNNYYDNYISILSLRTMYYKSISYASIFSEFDSRKKQENPYSYNIHKHCTNKIEIDSEGRYIFFLGKFDMESKKFKAYDLYEQKLVKLPNMPEKLKTLDTLLYNDGLYVLGESNRSEEFLTSCYRFSDDVWERLPDVSVKRKYRTIFVSNNKLHIIMGSNENDLNLCLNVEIMDLSLRNKWEQLVITDIPTPIKTIVYYVVDSRSILLFGGTLEEQDDDPSEVAYLIDLNTFQKIDEYALEDRDGNFTSCYVPPKFYRNKMSMIITNSEELFNYISIDN